MYFPSCLRAISRVAVRAWLCGAWLCVCDCAFVAVAWLCRCVDAVCAARLCARGYVCAAVCAWLCVRVFGYVCMTVRVRLCGLLCGCLVVCAWLFGFVCAFMHDCGLCVRGLWLCGCVRAVVCVWPRVRGCEAVCVAVCAWLCVRCCVCTVVCLHNPTPVLLRLALQCICVHGQSMSWQTVVSCTCSASHCLITEQCAVCMPCLSHRLIGTNGAVAHCKKTSCSFCYDCYGRNESTNKNSE